MGGKVEDWAIDLLRRFNYELPQIKGIKIMFQIESLLELQQTIKVCPPINSAVTASKWSDYELYVFSHGQTTQMFTPILIFLSSN